MQQTQAGPVLGVDTTRVPRAHTLKQALDCRHQMRGKALGSIVVVELLERSSGEENVLDWIKKVSKEWMISLVHTHTPRCTNIYN